LRTQEIEVTDTKGKERVNNRTFVQTYMSNT